MRIPIKEWGEERRSAWLYEVLARAEVDPVKRGLFESLRKSAEAQAGIWERELRAAGREPPQVFEPGLRARLVARLVRYLGPRHCRSALTALKVRGLSVYGAALRDGEYGHARPTTARGFEARHRTHGGDNLRAAVFGVSDGLVSNASLVLGIAGASSDAGAIVLTGAAGVLAGSASMAAGEYISVRSRRELYEHQIGLERAELAQYPDEEAEELALIYQARGLSQDKAREVARALMQDPERALDALAREELGLDPEALGSPWAAALSSFLAFALGALVPLIPFLWTAGGGALIWVAVLCAASLFTVGAVLSLFTGKSALWSGLRMTLIGGTAGLATWMIGSLFGVALG